MDTGLKISRLTIKKMITLTIIGVILSIYLWYKFWEGYKETKDFFITLFETGFGWYFAFAINIIATFTISIYLIVNYLP